PALSHIRTGGAFANGVKVQPVDQALQFAVIVTDRCRRAQPPRTLLSRGYGNQHYSYCTGGAATPTFSPLPHRVFQLPSSIGIPWARRSASVRHSGSPATSTSLKPGAGADDFIIVTNFSMRAANSSTGRNRLTSIAMKHWLTRTNRPRIRIP